MINRVFALLITTIILASTSPLAALAQSSTPFTPQGQPTTVPIGFFMFCKSHAEDCGRNLSQVAATQLTQPLWSQLLLVNNRFNTEIQAVTDQELYQTVEFWAYPNGKGDCEDYVLAKRRALSAAGWPLSTLLIAVVKQKNGDGHAVLIVRTDRGDMVLDNLNGEIKTWDQTPYLFVKRQSQGDAGQWVDIPDDRSMLIAATPAGAVGATQP